METNRENDLIELLFSLWEVAVKFANNAGRTDANNSSEGIALRILNILYNRKLENLNIPGACGGLGRIDYESVDLGWRGYEAYQVTSRSDKSKLDENVAKFHSKNLLQYFPLGIRFLILSSKTPSIKKTLQSNFAFFKPQEHIVNLQDLSRAVKELRNTNAEAYSEIKMLISSEFMPSLLALMPEIQGAKSDRQGPLRVDCIFKIKDINRKIRELQYKLAISTEDIFDLSKIEENCYQFTLENYNNKWLAYLTSLKQSILQVSQRLLSPIYELDSSMLAEILSIENQFLTNDIYDGAIFPPRVTMLPGMSVQELFIHNRILEVLNLKLESQSQELIKKYEENYRQKNYGDLEQWK